MIKDEAFVLGFTMGSSNRVTTTEERLFSFMTKYVYPKDYRFTDEDLHIFKDAVRLGFVSDCQSLAKVDYKKYLDWPLQKIREDIGIEVDLLKAYYAIEARRYPHIKECNRNLVGLKTQLATLACLLTGLTALGQTHKTDEARVIADLIDRLPQAKAQHAAEISIRPSGICGGVEKPSIYHHPLHDQACPRSTTRLTCLRSPREKNCSSRSASACRTGRS